MSDLRTELLRIRAKRGKLTPRIVYEEAKSKSHPLHDKIFDVTQKEAAERYYISNAAKLLRVTFRADVEGKPMDLRTFWVVKGTEEDPDSRYVPIEEIAMDPIARTVMLQQMRRDWMRFKNRYQNYIEFFDLIAGEYNAIGEDDPDEEIGPDDDEGDEPNNGTEG